MRPRIVKVWHAKEPNFGRGRRLEWSKENYECVAKFRFELHDTPQECADRAFTLTQVIGELLLEESKFEWVNFRRPTTVGDVVTVSGVAYRYESCPVSKIE